MSIGLFTNILESTQVQQITGTRYQLFAQNPELLRRQLRELALQYDLDIISMQSENQSLESVFKELTGKSE